MNPIEEGERDDAWPDEPEEFDPDSLGPDAPDSAPTIRESLGDSEALPEELFRAFWASVLLLNVALIALSVGAMLLYFRGDRATGGPLVAIGLVAAVAVFRRYWKVRRGGYRTDGEGGRGTESGGGGEKP